MDIFDGKDKLVTARLSLATFITNINTNLFLMLLLMFTKSHTGKFGRNKTLCIRDRIVSTIFGPLCREGLHCCAPMFVFVFVYCIPLGGTTA